MSSGGSGDINIDTSDILIDGCTLVALDAFETFFSAPRAIIKNNNITAVTIDLGSQDTIMESNQLNITGAITCSSSSTGSSFLSNAGATGSQISVSSDNFKIDNCDFGQKSYAMVALKIFNLPTISFIQLQSGGRHTFNGLNPMCSNNIFDVV